MSATTFTDPITGLDNSPASLERDAIRAEFLATTTIRDATPEYIAEWNHRFNSRTAWIKADAGNKLALTSIASRYEFDPRTL